MTLDAAPVGERLAVVRARLDAVGGSGVTIVAVTKGFGPEAITIAGSLGLLDVGENYAQEALSKLDAVRAAGARLHLIGRLQTNKVRALAPHVWLWQSIDRLALADEVARRAPGASVLVQVNVSDEPTKAGCAPSEVAALVEAMRGRLGLDVRGLMAIGRTGAPAEAAPGFRLLRGLVDGLGLEVCSMGMTDDLEIAVVEGATMVRVGSALFGSRPGGPGGN